MGVFLRRWSANDLSALVSLANDLDAARWLTDAFPRPYTAADGATFIERVSQENPVHVFCIEANGQVAGGIGIFPQVDIQRRNAKIGYWLGAPYRGKGIMMQAIPQIVEKGIA